MNKMYPILGTNWLNYSKLIDQIISNLKTYSYSFMPADKFRKVLKTFPAEGMRIYWDEILYRAHYAALVAILRSHRWAGGVQTAYEDKNYLSFCANLRGLLEAGSDSFESLGRVPKTIATLFKTIREPYKDKTMSQCSNLENMLIHFSHGRYIKRGETAPDSHQAKSPSAYLKSLDPKDSSRFFELYGELCEATHPAAPTVFLFLTPTDETGDSIALSASDDALLIHAFMDRFRDVINEIMEYTFNPPFITLRVLNCFKNPKIETPEVEDICFDNIKLWRDCKALLQGQDINRKG